MFRFHRLIILLLSACLSLLSLSPSWAVPKKAPEASVASRLHTVTVTRLTWHGWPGSLRISNGVVEAIVVPTIGRITLFQFVGQPQTSPIFINTDWGGKTVADADAGTWAAFGGDKLWPSPQSDWPKHNVRAWPPDQTFDGDPEVAQIVPGGVRLTTPNSVAFAAHAVRTIIMKPGSARLYISQTLFKDMDAASPETLPAGLSDEQASRLKRDGFPIGIWSITQTRGDETVFLPLSTSGKFPAGYTSLSNPGGTEAAPYFTTSSGLLRIARDTQTSHKVGTVAAAGWIASLYSGNILFSEHYPFQADANYPDGGLPAETYTNAGATAYIEMELLGPLVSLRHGNKITHNIYWQLQRLPHAPKSAADADALVMAAMR